ncbi:CLUMA_CG014671, isoform A [Clunio marinus]|uniref:CLUMA_CG014671, isoform A n=1 Tax=Clunio marinus TaxID=568069 RepID=A0A1J1IP88_9DIPT|nr:CLUMA_CG014671, isoform A [Clunio marinus]
MDLKLKKFLIFMSLEKGGSIIGWFTMMFGVLLGMYSIRLIILSTIYYIDTYDTRVTDPEVISTERMIALTTIVLASIYFVYSIASIAAGSLLMDSVKKSTNKHMKLVMVILAIGIFFSAIQIIISFVGIVGIGVFAIGGIIVGIIILCLHTYAIICVHSLNDLFKNEELGRMQINHVQFQQPNTFQQHPSTPQLSSSQQPEFQGK